MGYKPIIIFDLIFSLYPFIIPILPNPSEYIMSIIYLLVPVFFAFRIVNFFEKKNDNLISSDYHRIKFKGILIPITAIIIMVYFYSGYFRYYSVAIASGSMEPNIYVGDVVIVDQKITSKDLEPGNIIAFKHNDVVVVHRIVNKIELDGKKVYYTKGDANNHIDDFLTDEQSIIGKVNIKIPYIGYPTVWFNKDR
jgi:signal peptidase